MNKAPGDERIIAMLMKFGRKELKQKIYKLLTQVKKDVCLIAGIPHDKESAGV